MRVMTSTPTITGLSFGCLCKSTKLHAPTVIEPALTLLAMFQDDMHESQPGLILNEPRLAHGLGE